MFKRLWKKVFLDTPLRTKMSYIFFVLLIFPMCFFSFYATNRIQKTMREQTFIATEKTFDEALLSLSTLTKKMNDVSDILASDSLLYSIISPTDYTSYIDYRTMSTKFTQLQMLSGIGEIRLYSDNQYFSFPISDIKQTNWYEKVSAKPVQQWFAPTDFLDLPADEQDCFSFMRHLYLPGSYTQSSGILRVDVSRATFEQALSQTTVTPSSVMLLCTADQVILSSNEKNLLLHQEAVALLQGTEERRWNDITLNGTAYYAMSATVEPSGWKLAVLIPTSDITRIRNQLFTEMLCITLILVVAAYFLALYLTGFILKRINQLTTAMKIIQGGNAAIQIENSDRDEIGQLVYCFNLMAGRIDELMDEKIQYGQDIKNLELQALQAQINPHFLYNTLDTINCIAIQKNAPEITGIVSALAAFYKISLSKGKDRIRIREEISHAQMYIKILDSRFPGKIQAYWDIAPEIENLQTIKIILQPIIENAAIHGIYEKESGTGILHVKGWLEGENVYITVEDDGVGIPQNVIDANFNEPTQDISGVGGGYGIRNICARVRIAYGPQYGLSCVSRVGSGTKVTIHIPKCL